MTNIELNRFAAALEVCRRKTAQNDTFILNQTSEQIIKKFTDFISLLLPIFHAENSRLAATSTRISSLLSPLSAYKAMASL